MYRPSMDFADRSNKEKKICRNHPTSIWGKDMNGNWYDRCVYGNRFNEDCKELIEEDPYVSKR